LITSLKEELRLKKGKISGKGFTEGDFENSELEMERKGKKLR